MDNLAQNKTDLTALISDLKARTDAAATPADIAKLAEIVLAVISRL